MPNVISFFAPGRGSALALEAADWLTRGGNKVALVDFSFNLAKEVGMRQPRASLASLIKAFQKGSLGRDCCNKKNCSAYFRRAVKPYISPHGNRFDVVFGHPRLAAIDWKGFYWDEEAPAKVFNAWLMYELREKGYNAVVLNGPSEEHGSLPAILIDMPDIVVLVGNVDHPGSCLKPWLERIAEVNLEVLSTGSKQRRPGRMYDPVRRVLVEVYRGGLHPADVLLTEDLPSVCDEVLLQVLKRLGCLQEGFQRTRKA